MVVVVVVLLLLLVVAAAAVALVGGDEWSSVRATVHATATNTARKRQGDEPVFL